MLAATAPAVKLQTSSTPEQAGCAKAIDRSLTIFWTLVERLRAAADQRQPIHQVEEAIFRDLLAMGRDLLRAYLALSGDGDAGPDLTVPGDGPDDPPQVLPRLDQPRAPLPVDLRRGRDRADRLWPGATRSRPARRPTSPAPAAVLVPVATVAGGVRPR